MHVLYLHQYFVPPGQNGGIRSYEMAKRLAQDGFVVDLITSSAFFGRYSDLEAGWNQINIDGVNVHVLRLPYSNNMGFFKRVFIFLYFAVRSCAYVFKFSPAVVFATSTPLTISIPAILLSKTKSIPFVFEVRDLWPEVPISIGVIKNRVLIFLSRFLEKISYASAHHIIALSPGIKEGVRRVSDKPVTVIPNASDIEFFASSQSRHITLYNEYPFLRRRPYLVYAGTLGAVNNIDYLVDLAVLSKVNGSTFTIVIFGDGKEKSRIISKARNEGVLGDTLYICDPVPKALLSPILKNSVASLSTVIPCPAMFNNSANKFFDALAVGKPIIINHEGWLADLIRDHDCGLVLSPYATQADFVSIHELLSDDRLYEWVCENSFELASNRFERGKLYMQFKSALLGGLSCD